MVTEQFGTSEKLKEGMDYPDSLVLPKMRGKKGGREIGREGVGGGWRRMGFEEKREAKLWLGYEVNK